MKDREFINSLIQVYFSSAKEPHQATLDNAITNRLNDIADKLEKQDKVLEIIKDKWVNVAVLIHSKTVEEYNNNKHTPYNLTEEQFDLLKMWQKKF